MPEMEDNIIGGLAKLEEDPPNNESGGAGAELPPSRETEMSKARSSRAVSAGNGSLIAEKAADSTCGSSYPLY
jgi:hypothetical protein